MGIKLSEIKDPWLRSRILSGSIKPKDEPEVKRRLRQDHKPLLNKLETRYLLKLKTEFPDQTFFPQALRFKLGNGIWYKPDIVCFDHALWGIAAWEVKGPHAFRGGFENLKVAAHQYPQVIFTMVWDDFGWNEQQVIP